MPRGTSPLSGNDYFGVQMLSWCRRRGRNGGGRGGSCTLIDHDIHHLFLINVRWHYWRRSGCGVITNIATVLVFISTQHHSLGCANTPPFPAILDLADTVIVAVGGREGSGSIEIRINDDRRCTPSHALEWRLRGIAFLSSLLRLFSLSGWKRSEKYVCADIKTQIAVD